MFANMDHKERSFTIMENNYIPGLSELISELLSKNKHTQQIENLYINMMKTWNFLLEEKGSTMPSPLEIKALLASFFFQDEDLKIRGFEALFSQENEIVRIFNSSPHRVEVITKAVKVLTNYEGHDSNHYLLNNALSVLTGLMKTHS